MVPASRNTWHSGCFRVQVEDDSTSCRQLIGRCCRLYMCSVFDLEASGLPRWCTGHQTEVTDAATHLHPLPVPCMQGSPQY